MWSDSACRSISGESSTIRCTDIWINSSKESNCCRTRPFSSKYELITIQHASCHRSRVISSPSSSSYTASVMRKYYSIRSYLANVVSANVVNNNSKITFSYHHRGHTWLLYCLLVFITLIRTLFWLSALLNPSIVTDSTPLALSGQTLPPLQPKLNVKGGELEKSLRGQHKILPSFG